MMDGTSRGKVRLMHLCTYKMLGMKIIVASDYC